MASGPLWKGRTSFMASVRGLRRTEPAAFTGLLPATSAIGRRPLDIIRQDGHAEWQISHQLSPVAFLRFGGTSLVGGGRNLGIGGLNLPERAYTTTRFDHTGRLSLLAGHDAKLFNQLRVSARTAGESWEPVSETPAILVAGAFISGGAVRAGGQRVWAWSIEDDLDIVRGAHALRVGVALERQSARSSERVNETGTFTFASLTDFEQSRPLTFTRRIGQPIVCLAPTRGGAYIQDDIQLGKRVSLGLGVRWEAQSAVRDHWNFAPRIRLSWSLRRLPATTVKGGVGWYYDWVETDILAQILRMDGTAQAEMVVINPGYPDAASGDSTLVLPPSRYVFASDASLPMVRRLFLGIDHQIGNASFRLVVEDMQSANGLRGRNLNAPLPGGVRPFPDFGNVIFIESARRSSIRTVRAEARSRWWHQSLAVVSYELRWSKNNADGPFSIPSDSRNPEVDWGPSSDDVRHRAAAYLFMPVSRALILTATATVASGTPYTITTGRDDNGDTVVNDRPEGVARNSKRGGVTSSVDARVMCRVLGPSPGQPASGSGNGSSQRSPALTLYLSVQNVLNRTNPAAYTGVLGSPLFGRPLAAQAMRRIEAGLTVGF
jgi:hypothetical protein